MSGSIQSAGATMGALARHYRVITHNLANVNTAGFKRSISSMSQSASPSSQGAAGETSDRISVNFAQGRLVRTGRALDLALEGSKSFFVIDTPQGPLYTRNGVFRLNATGQLVDAAGLVVSGEGGPIVVPPSVGVSGINIARDGSISSATGQDIGKLRIVEFDDPARLVQVGGTTFKAPETVSPMPAAKATVHQGFQEASNVTAVEELVDLIMLSRLYEANLKTVQAQDERMKSILKVAMG